MPKIRSHGEVIHVVYDAGDDWLLVLPEGGGLNDFASRGNILWVTQYGRILFYDLVARRLIGTVGRGTSKPRSQLSRDERRLFVQFVSPDPDAPVPAHSSLYDLVVIDIATATVVSDCRLEPKVLIEEMREADDGYIIASHATDKFRPARLSRIDPSTGKVETMEVPKASEYHAFHNGSPDGRYWLRSDRRIASIEVPDGKPGLFGRRKVPYYTPVVQLWEAWPPRFLRWLPVGWTHEDDMPADSARYSEGKAEFLKRTWPRIVEASEATAHDPGVDVLWPRPGETGDWNDELLKAMQQEWHGFTHGIHGWWERDGSGFWAACARAIFFVGLDGSVSAGEYATVGNNPYRQPMHGGVEVLPGHAIRVGYSQGDVTYRGRGTGPARATAIPFDDPAWSNKDKYQLVPAVQERVERALAARDRITVPLIEWSDAGVVAAIEAIRLRLVAELPLRKSESASIAFEHGGKNQSEKTVFERVTKKHPAAAPAIALLIGDVCTALQPRRPFFGDSNEVNLLGHAARALGLLDLDAMPVLKRYYSIMVDSEHEFFFTTQTVPLLIEHHGWRPQLIDLVWWLMLQQPTNGLDHYGRVWDEWGLGDAVTSAFTPTQFAAFTATLMGPSETTGKHPARLSYHGVDTLARDVSATPWLKTFFEAMASPAERQPG